MSCTARLASVTASRAALFAIMTALTASCSPPAPDLANVNYALAGFTKACDRGSKTGETGGTNRMKTPEGLRISVRTPANYDATLAHPLLVVYPPGGHHRYQSENLAGLTTAATAAGFVVAYPDHVTLKLESFKLLGKVPEAVASKWCIDPGRIYATGHSDGGLASEAIVFLGASTLPLAGIVASGAGIRGEDLSSYACPSPLPVMIIHSRDDALFPLPAYGREAADWWAKCNRCEAGQFVKRDDGCIAYSGCQQGGQTLYCEVSGAHRLWHGENAILLQFLSEHR